MSTFDIVLLVIIGGFGLFGLWFGIVHTLGSLMGTVLGIFLASHYYSPVADWIIKTTGWGENVSRVIVFAVAFILINRLVGLAFWLVEKFLNIFLGLPFIGTINRMFGLIFGLLEGILVVGFIFYFIARFPIGENFMTMLGESQIAPYTVKLAAMLWPLLPEALRILKSTVENII